jgi:hypothetical protein
MHQRFLYPIFYTKMKYSIRFTLRSMMQAQQAVSLLHIKYTNKTPLDASTCAELSTD